MLKHLNPERLICLLFLVLVHLLYFRTMQAGFVTDFSGLQERLEGAPFSGFLTCFGFPALHQVTNFFLYIFYKLFSINGLPWYLIFTSLHVANGWLGYRLALRIFSGGGLAGARQAAVATAVLFLLNPYQVEAVVWKVCLNFLLCSLLMLSSLLCWLRFWETGRRKGLFGALIFCVIGLLTFELALATPLLAAVLWYWERLRPEKAQKREVFLKRKIFSKFFFSKIPLSKNPSPVSEILGQPRMDKPKPPFDLAALTLFCLLIPLYFLANKALLGGWVGHYGEAVHLKFDPDAIGGNLLKYFSKYLVFWREMPHGWKESWVGFCDRPLTGWLFLGFCGLAFAAFLLSKKRRLGSLTLLCFLLFFIALAPVSNLYVAWILQGENDRYGYLASLFFFMGMSAMLWRLPKYWRYGFLALLLGCSIFFTQRMTGYWQQSTRIFYSLLKDFRWQEAPEVYVLAFPENYQGIPLFKDFTRKDLALRHALKYSAGTEVKGRIFQVAQYNVTSPEDGIEGRMDSLHHYSATFKQWGCWWWRHGIGTGGYETEHYTFHTFDKGCQLILSKPVEGAVVIYADGEKWKEAK